MNTVRLSFRTSQLYRTRRVVWCSTLWLVLSLTGFWWFCFVWCHFWPLFRLENGRVYSADWAIQRSDFLPCQSRIAKSLFPSKDLKRLLLSSLWVHFPWCFSLYFSNKLGRNSIVALLPTAYLRRSLALQGQGLKERATEDLYKALAIDPSNKRAKVNFSCWLLSVKAFFMLLHHRLTFKMTADSHPVV